MNTSNAKPPPNALIATAFIAVYLIWGSTYLGIRVAVETMPPFLMGAVRFLIAGLILYIVLRLRGVPNPEATHWKNAAIVGTLLIGAGNGGVCWAEQEVPSNVTALMIGATPIWFALLDWLRPGGSRPEMKTVIGILIGFGGLALMVAPQEDSPLTLSGTIALITATICWAIGSLFARYTPKPKNTLMGIALQMITGAGSLFLIALPTGEYTRLDIDAISAASLYAFIYLVLIGALVGFTAYSWLLKVTSPAKLATYAYVNPVIAVILGWLILNETLNVKSLWAAASIIVGVIIILVPRRRQAKGLTAPTGRTEKLST